MNFAGKMVRAVKKILIRIFTTFYPTPRGGRFMGSPLSQVFASTEPMVFVIAEHGSQWIGWARRYEGSGRTVVAVVQKPRETRSAFIQRVRETLTETARAERTIHTAVIVGTPKPVEAALADQRIAVWHGWIRAIAARMAPSRQGEIILDPGKAPTWVKKAIDSLAQLVSEQVTASGITVRPAELPPLVLGTQN